MRTVLIIAGSDSGGGAGIQADIKSVSAMGCFPTTAIAALTAQNTQGVNGILEVSPDFVLSQIEAILADLGADAVKTGMLFNEKIILSVSQRLQSMASCPLVVDPVMVSTSGHDLLEPSAMEALKERLLPLAAVITPNLAEASRLTGREVKTEKEMREAARDLLTLGPAWILLKGGHLSDRAKDLLVGKDGEQWLDGPRLETDSTHGTGCTLASALAAGLAQGLTVPEAAQRAKDMVTEAIRKGPGLGKGKGPVDPMAMLREAEGRREVLGALCEAGTKLEALRMGSLIPEVQSNLVYALPGACSVKEVAGFPGRIVRLGDGVRMVSLPAFGASSHTARVVLTVLSKDPTLRSCAVIRFSEEILDACERAGLRLCSFDRAGEPKDVKEKEGASLPWGVGEALSKDKGCDAIFDRGGMGKEPVIRVLGRDPRDVVEKLGRVLEKR